MPDTKSPTATEDGPSARTAVAFVGHTLAGDVPARFEKLRREAGPDRDVFFAFDRSAADAVDLERARELAGERLWPFDPDEVLSTPYPAPGVPVNDGSLVPGNVDLLFLAFADAHPDYERYWFVEYDVAFSGTWATVFDAVADADAGLVGTTLHPHAQKPDWHWWPDFEPPEDVPRERWVRGFLPIVRLTATALDRLDAAYRDGWSGHQEVVVPTVVSEAGLGLRDLGGAGPYVPDGATHRFYTNTPEQHSLSPGSFVYRPERARPGRRSDTLWHPIKPDAGAIRPYWHLAKQWLLANVLDR